MKAKQSVTLEMADELIATLEADLTKALEILNDSGRTRNAAQRQLAIGAAAIKLGAALRRIAEYQGKA